MERKPPSSLVDFIVVIKRRKYSIVLPSVVVIALAVALSPLVPRTYKSTTTMLVNPPKVPSVYVRSTGNSNETDHLQKISLEVLSGKGFAQIINKLNLYPDLRKTGHLNRAIARMRKNISVDPVLGAGDGRGGVGAFTISYIGDSPQQARDVTKDLSDLFIQENLKEGHQEAQGANSFLTAQLAEAAQRLSAQQARIQAFKAAHISSLPEQAQANLQLISQYQSALQANADSLDQANQQRVYLQSVLNVNPNGDQGADAPSQATPLQLELAQKQEELRADLLKYTGQHPDIVRLEHDIAALKMEIEHAPKASSSTPLIQTPLMNGPSANDQLRSQLVALNTEIKARQGKQEQIKQKLAELQGSVGTLPAVQTQYAALDSDYQEKQKNYNTLLENQQEAAIASALDQRDQNEQFLVLQPASFSHMPYRPDPVLMYMGEVLVGLLIGFIWGLIVELRDDTMHDADEVAVYLKLPVMVALPKCPPFPDKTWKENKARS